MKFILKKYRFQYSITIVLSIIQACMFAIFSIKLGAVIDTIGKNNDKLFHIILMCIGIISIWFVVSSLLESSKSRYAYLVIKDIKSRLYTALNNKKMDEYMSKQNEYYLNIFTKNIDLIHDNYLIPRCVIVSNIISALISIIAIFSISWKLALCFLVITAFTIILSQIPGVIMAKKTKWFSEKNSEYLSVINNHLKGFEQIKLLRVFPNFYMDYKETDEEFENSRKNYFTVTWISDILGMFFGFFSQLLCISIGVYFIINGHLTVGLLIAAINLLNSVFGPVQSFAYNKNLIKTVDEIYNEYDEIINAKTEDKLIIDKPIDEILYKNLSINFYDKRKVIDNLNYKFEKGKIYAIKGESGSGKSTLMKVLMRYYKDEIYSGEIQIDGKNIRDISENSIYSKIAYVQRNDFFVPGTVRDNIFLNRDIEGCGDLFKDLKLSDELLDKKIESGSRYNVSTGEKQRIDIARFLVNDYDVLIFDEPTSNLDSETSEVIFDLIFKIKNKIVIVITHNQDEKLLSKFDEVITI